MSNTESCTTIEALDNTLSDPKGFEELKQRMTSETQQLFFTTHSKERADMMAMMYAMKKPKALPNDGYAGANAQIGEFMRIAMSGNYDALKENILSKNRKVFGGDEMGISIFVGAAQSGLSTIDYLNQIYGTNVTADTKLTKSDGTEISFSDALTGLIIEEGMTGARQKIAELRASCPETPKAKLSEIHELPFQGLHNNAARILDDASRQESKNEPDRIITIDEFGKRPE